MAHQLTQRQRHNLARKSPPDDEPEFQIAPMVDILLVLLIFFISVSSTEVLQPNRAINLPVAPEAKNAARDNPGQVIVNVSWTGANAGRIEVDQRQYPSPEALIPELERVIAANPLARVLIRADRSVRYEYLRRLMQAIGQAGVSNVTFSVADKESAAADAADLAPE